MIDYPKYEEYIKPSKLKYIHLSRNIFFFRFIKTIIQHG